MIELPLIFMSGILGSSHCIGMCGPFAAILGSNAQSWRQNISWQLLYSVGRIFTYATLGAMAGYGGHRLVGIEWQGVNLTGVLAIVAGVLLIREGLVTAGLWRKRFGFMGANVCPSGGLLRSLIRQQSRLGVFLAGIATGFLPCGLVYAFLLTAARTSSLMLGTLVMVVFGLGTVPLMVATGTSASAIPIQWRARMFSVAGWCVVAMGGLSIYRGWAFLFTADPEACPHCVHTLVRHLAVVLT